MFNTPIVLAVSAVAILAVGAWTVFSGQPAAPTATPDVEANTPAIQAGTYVIDAAHSEVGFRVKHLGISTVKGSFEDVDATIVFGADDISSLQAQANIATESVNTRNTDRDNHLRSPDFFASEDYPVMKFVSTSVDARDDGTFTLTGDLTIRETTKSVDLAGTYRGLVVDPWGNTKIGLTATGQIDRKEFGLVWNKAIEAGGLVVGDQVWLDIEIQAGKVDPPSAG